MLLLSLACTPVTLDPGSETTDTADPVVEEQWAASFYEPLRLLEVDVELPEDDWEELRNQSRNLIDMLSGEDCLAEPFERPYTWFEGEVSLDGQPFSRVGVRKKGLLGSVEPGRPSLKLQLNRELDQHFEEVTAITLNNGRQDATRLKTCMGYEILGRAGVAAPRCSLAHVTVNGEDLGLYANVEPIKPPLLARSFGGDGSGDLYEGTLSDFRTGWVSSFQDKNGGDLAELEALTEAVEELDDEDFLARVEELVDLDQFMEFWAAEVLIGHWDGYNGNTNNFWVYVGDDGRLRFLVWGIDAVLVGDEPFGQGRPTSVVAASALARRLYGIEESRQRYLDTLDELMTRVWNEEGLQDHFDDLQQVGSPVAWPEGKPDAWYEVLSAMEDFLATREETIRDEIEEGAPAWTAPLRADPCLLEHGTMSVQFDTSWGSYGTLPTWSTGSGELSLTIDGVDYSPSFMTALAGEYEPGQSLLLVGGTLDDGSHIALYALGATEHFGEAGVVHADWSELTTYLLVDPDGDYANWNTAAWMSGELELDQSSLVQGAPVSGSGSFTIWGG